jgi:hypothetical protein
VILISQSNLNFLEFFYEAMTIVSSSASPTAMCNNETEATSTSESACASCRKLNDEIKTTVTQMAGKLDNLVVRVEEIYRQQQILRGKFI